MASFTNHSKRIERVLPSQIGIASSGQPSPFKDYTAIWDTGATASVITDKIVTELGLQPIGLTQVKHAHGQAQAEVYLVNIRLPNKVAFAGVKVTKGILANTDALIGMDIITQGDFSVSNFNGTTMFSFRVPSTEHTDFTGKIPIKVPPKAGRNSPCPCGSGQKYKRCCGK